MIVKSCNCGHNFVSGDIKPPLLKTEAGFFGGRVSRYTDIKCECGSLCRLYIKPKGQTWEVVGAEILKKKSPEKTKKTAQSKKGKK